MNENVQTILSKLDANPRHAALFFIPGLTLLLVVGKLNFFPVTLGLALFFCGVYYFFLNADHFSATWTLVSGSLLGMLLSVFSKNPNPVILAGLPLFFMIYLALYYSDDAEVVRGLRRLKGLARRENRESADGTGVENGVVLCKNEETQEDVVLYDHDRFLHMLILGPTGSGKTSQIILPMINQDMKRGKGITVIEPKGDLAEKVYAMGKVYNRDVFFFDPSHPDCPYFNPLYGDEVEVIENIATTFMMLSTGSSDYFVTMNDNLIRNSVKVVKRLYDNQATIKQLYDLMNNINGAGNKMVVEFQRLSPESTEIERENAEIAAWFLQDYFNERSKTYEHTSGLRSQLQKLMSNKYLRKILIPPDGKTDIDFGDIIENEKILAISTAQGTLRELSRYLGYFIILNYQSAVFRRPGDEDTRPHHFLYIDEFQSYANPGFGDMLTQGRSYRVASILATQNRALIGMNSGRDGKSFTELVSTNARNLVLFPGGNGEDARYYSNEFGEYLKSQRQVSTSRNKYDILPFKSSKETVRVDERYEQSFSSSDLIYQPFGYVHYKIVQNNTLMPPGLGKISFIPKELNNKIKDIVNSYKQKIDPETLKLRDVDIDTSEFSNDKVINQNMQAEEFTETEKSRLDPLVYLSKTGKLIKDPYEIVLDEPDDDNNVFINLSDFADDEDKNEEENVELYHEREEDSNDFLNEVDDLEDLGAINENDDYIDDLM